MHKIYNNNIDAQKTVHYNISTENRTYFEKEVLYYVNGKLYNSL